MRYPCIACGKSATSELPNDSIIRGAITCPECIEGIPSKLLEGLQPNDPDDERMLTKGIIPTTRRTPIIELISLCGFASTRAGRDRSEKTGLIGLGVATVPVLIHLLKEAQDKNIDRVWINAEWDDDFFEHER